MKYLMIATIVFSLGCSSDENNKNNANNTNNAFNNGITNNSNNANNANNTNQNNTNQNNVNNMKNVNNMSEMEAEPAYAFCQTTDDGCAGLFEYACFFEVMSQTGVCRTQCTEAEYMTQGSCPAGTICERYETTIHTVEMPSYFYGCN